MNKKIEKALRESFEAPPPVDKERFLKTLGRPGSTYVDFLLNQLTFIRKRVWAFSVIIAFIGWAVTFRSPVFIDWHAEAEKLWIISAGLPFLALMMTAEIYRSAFYRMSELEMSFRFNLPQIIMARIAILGGGSFVILTVLLIFISRVSPFSLLQVITYLMVPYLITCGVCLLILNRVRPGEGLYFCAAAACFTCMVNIIASSTVQLFYSSSTLGYWLLLFVLSGVLTGIQLRNLIKQTEERTWNLILTE
jgi:hypothetical protein